MNGINKDVFIRKYVDAFGEKAELPIVFYYDDKPAGVNEKTGGCFFKCFDSVRNGRAISLSAETIGCGGGKLYTGFAPMPPHVPGFVSGKERYKGRLTMCWKSSSVWTYSRKTASSLILSA